LKTLRIATRKSPLALWQAEFVRHRLQSEHPGLQVELLKMSTQGDKILDTPLAKIGGKGLFIKELEHALLSGNADIAVHSSKDMPVDLPKGLHIHTICEREDPRDALVSNQFNSLAELPAGARLGTSSLRRRCQLAATYPKLEILELRGNVNTRLAKLDAGKYDAIILAAAGLKRLQFDDRITACLTPESSLPAVGQGAVCIECRRDDRDVHTLLSPLDHHDTRVCVLAERAMNETLQGGCQVPIAGYAMLRDTGLWLRGLVGHPDSGAIVTAETTGAIADHLALGKDVALQLLHKGAADILKSAYAP